MHRHRPSLRISRALAVLAPVGLAVLLMASLIGLLAPSEASALEPYAILVPNQALAENSVGTVRPCITCHNNPDGGDSCGDGTSFPAVEYCLNDFGVDFRASRISTPATPWNPALAAMDSDGDGFTNGQELQDPLGTWVLGDPTPGFSDCVSRPGFATLVDGTPAPSGHTGVVVSPGEADGDGDGYCCFGQDMNADMDCMDAGENGSAVFDCDDSNMAIHSEAMELCTNTFDDDCNGLDTLSDPVCESVVDRDGDGFCVMGRDTNGDLDCIDPGEADGSIDCEPLEVTVYPGAPENCSDGLDNNCNGLTDMDDGACRPDVDNDMDGYCPLGQDLNGDGDCLDAGEQPAGVGDCNDMDMSINPAAMEICDDGADNDCDNGADFRDGECEGFFDGDNDGYCPLGQDLNGDQDCIDAGESGGLVDCNDEVDTINPDRTELCTNAQDDDCDGDISLADTDCAGYLDTDGDRYCRVGFDMMFGAKEGH